MQKHKTLLYFFISTLIIVTVVLDIKFLYQTAEFISEFFIKIFKFLGLPMVMLSIVSVISGANENISLKMANKATMLDHDIDDKNSSTKIKNGLNQDVKTTLNINLKSLWSQTLAYAILTTAIAALVAFALYLAINPGMISFERNNSELYDTTDITNKFSNFSDFLTSEGGIGTQNYLLNIIPNNIVDPFVNNKILTILFIAIVFGFAISAIPNPEQRRHLSCFFQSLYQMFITISQYVVKLLPIALFGFITTTIVELKGQTNFRGIGYYLSIIVVANLLQGIIVLPAILRICGIQPLQLIKKSLPALQIAFFAKSSSAALPVTIDIVQKRMGVHSKVAQSILPLCTSINMNACAAFIFTTVVYVMQNNGYNLSILEMLLWVIIAIIAAIGNAAVPMGCFFMSASLLSSMGVSIQLLGIILPFYTIIDMLETALNVWSDICITKIVNKRLNIPSKLNNEVENQ